MEEALSQCVQGADQTQCMRTTISLYRGATDHNILKCRQKLLVFLKGSAKSKEELKKEDPEMYHHFNIVWRICHYHMDHSLPAKYVFLLRCCGKSAYFVLVNNVLYQYDLV
jgi:hypothetical protein